MEIGGYFELELSRGNENSHCTPYRFNSGRSALAFILVHVKPTNVYVPFYTCNALLEPFIKHNIQYTFYSVDCNLEIEETLDLKPTELLLYINYYDVKRDYTKHLSNLYGNRFIGDCTQSYFFTGNSKSWFFNSCRKFFGVPDGSYLYVPDGYDLLSAYHQLCINKTYLTAHLVARFNGETQKGYPFFQENEVLNGNEMAKMSKLTIYLLSNINEAKVTNDRITNFEFVHKQLKSKNELKLPEQQTPVSSFYPYLPNQFIDKKLLWDKQIFAPNFWADCLVRPNHDDYPFEKRLSQYLIPIPIDHRYQPSDLIRILNILND